MPVPACLSLHACACMPVPACLCLHACACVLDCPGVVVKTAVTQLRKAALFKTPTIPKTLNP